jgi:outer membrane protein assembly factor BamB
MENIQQKPLRLLPGVIIVIIQWILRFGIPSVFHGDGATQLGVFAGLLGGLALIIWWAFFSRAPRLDRWGGAVLIIVSLLIAAQFLDKSISTSMMGLMYPVYSLPVFCLAFVVWALVNHKFSTTIRRITMAATILLSFGIWVFLRTDGMDAETNQVIAWRWAKTDEERILNRIDGKLKNISVDSASMARAAEWPGFRGINRDGIIHGTRIATDWTKTPPVEMWRRPVGGGCSSFAIHGSLLYTQEQRGELELVTCYDINTGELVWKHGDKVRFWDSHAGAGPRSTPTLYKDRVFTMGGTGILNVLDAYSGALIWSRDAAAQNEVKALTWGFSGSPLVVNNNVLVSLAGKLAAYDAAGGKLLWSGSDGGNSYSSPHLVTIEGVQQVILMSQKGALSVDPVSGKELWQYPWEFTDRILQPAVISEGDLLLDGVLSGLGRFRISHASGEWTVKETWKSPSLKLNFNDIIIDKGFVYGFDGPAIACVDINDGVRRWRGAPYRGFSILLADQDVLLVISEKGELALVEAAPGKFTELGKIKALKDKVWNHPAISGNIVVVRNSNEMAAYRISNGID